jgi:hypothetical protein
MSEAPRKVVIGGAEGRGASGKARSAGTRSTRRGHTGNGSDRRGIQRQGEGKFGFFELSQTAVFVLKNGRISFTGKRSKGPAPSADSLDADMVRSYRPRVLQYQKVCKCLIVHFLVLCPGCLSVRESGCSCSFDWS